MIDLVNRLNMPDVHIFAWDARGHGNSPGERGHAPSFGTIVRDIDSFTRSVTAYHNLQLNNVAVLANSVAAVATAAWVHDYHPPIRAMALIAPAFHVKLYVPLAVPALRLLSFVKPKANISSYVKGKMLTHDPDMAESYNTDPLVSRNIAVNILLGLRDTAKRILADADAISTPTIILSAGSDYVVRNSDQKRFFDTIASPIKKHITYPGTYHALLHEKDRNKPIAAARSFLLDQLEASPGADQSRTTTPRPSTEQRFDQLSRPAPIWQKPYWTIQRLFLSTLCRLSEGVRIGYSDGFDSGRSLDHVYRNTAQGTTPLGRLIDRIYLNAAGWKGIRQRKINMQNVLNQAITQTHRRQTNAHILDIAAGPGRYILDTLAQHRPGTVTATLQDRDIAGLESGRTAAQQLNLSDHVTYQPGDAFDAQSLAAADPIPDIAVVSGLYELFANNNLIAQSLRGLHEALPQNGILIYTNQPWHPQLDMIARTLPNRDHKPWIMRCRSQAEMDHLVAAVGFTKLQTLADDEGIFTVSIAAKNQDA